MPVWRRQGSDASKALGRAGEGRGGGGAGTEESPRSGSLGLPRRSLLGVCLPSPACCGMPTGCVAHREGRVGAGAKRSCFEERSEVRSRKPALEVLPSCRGGAEQGAEAVF